MMRILTIILLCASLLTVACGNQKKEENMEQTTKEVKTGLAFTLFFRHNNCSYEVLVNDMLVVSHFGLGEFSGLTVDLNKYILEAGRQEVTIRMFPRKVDKNKFASNLDENSYVKVKLEKEVRSNDEMNAWNARAKGIDINWVLQDYTTPEIEGEHITFKEYKLSFEVLPKEMTWSITGWSKSQDLRKDPNIRAEVDMFYNEVKLMLEKGDGDKYISLVKKLITEEAASTPWDDTAEYYLTKSMKEDAEEKKKFIYPCTNAELKFFGEGRVVTLVCMDTLIFGYAPLISKSKKNILLQANTFYLHKPIGSDKLEIIR